ncbi:hypothetical protein CJP72_10220 [Citrobacter sp. NCU1]|uniref:flagellar transcriptional regulator FlhD n=1 Tax=Citrobacter sp. NCU1 TaxID=2026683 RepID=UPI001390F30E|nr:flagellar transcriptional regulator FlhD [Citrobacter sp. NCU1]NDO81126.1 hypothetical protein [Citrobacter sp. NCU1]
MTKFSYQHDVQSINLSYLSLAQNMIKHDKASAMFRLGLTESLADLMGMLTSAQMVKLSSLGQFLFHLRLDDKILDSMLAESRVEDVQSVHAGILLSTGMLDKNSINHE